jgi:chromosome partitioning protein
MATVISVGIQKGGCGKSTTASVLAYELSLNYKVLAVDMDGQGNLTQVLTGIDDIYEFGEKTIYEAIRNENPNGLITQITDNLHMIAGDEAINTLCPYFYNEAGLNGKYHNVLRNTLEKVKNDYDYIIIDNPPQLGELSIISLTASDFVLILFETSKFCYNSLKSYLNTIDTIVERVNPNLKKLGILRSLTDKRRTDNKYYSKLIEKEYPRSCFKSIIHRVAVIGRLPSYGLLHNPEIRQVLKEYKPLLKEVKGRLLEWQSLKNN